MDKFDSDEELTNTLLTALQAAKKYRQRWEERRDAKLWTKIEVPLGLANALPRLTKDDLNRIRQNLNLKNLSSLNKGDLIARMQEMIPTRLAEELLLFDRNRYNLVRNIIKNGGWSPVPQLCQTQLNYLLYRGIAFPGTIDGQKVLVMPMENIEVFKKLDDRNYQSVVDRNWDIIRLVQGTLYYYGTMGHRMLTDLIRKHGIEPGNTLAFFQLVDHAIAYYGEIRWDNNGLSNSQVFDDRQVINEQNARPDLDYYPFSREQLIRAGDPNFVDRNATYRSFVDFIIENYEIDRDNADELVEECVYAVHIGAPITGIMEFLKTTLEIDDLDLLQVLMEHTVNLMNNTRQWFLKGYTSNELSKMEMSLLETLPAPPASHKKAEVFSLKTRKKVGRNDPCPCGSGIKFKKCCGRNSN